jgi:hypothetical protein
MLSIFILRVIVLIIFILSVTVLSVMLSILIQHAFTLSIRTLSFDECLLCVVMASIVLLSVIITECP